MYYVMMIERVIETETKQSKCLVTCNRVKSKFSKKVTLCHYLHDYLTCQLLISPTTERARQKTKKAISARFTFHEKNGLKYRHKKI